MQNQINLQTLYLFDLLITFELKLRKCFFLNGQRKRIGTEHRCSFFAMMKEGQVRNLDNNWRLADSKEYTPTKLVCVRDREERHRDKLRTLT